MARLLNRPMSSSTALSNLLGQRGQQEAQMSLARMQPWTSAVTNMGKMTAQSLASKYAADKARPAEALKMMSQIETMQGAAATRKYREAQLKTEGQTSAKTRAATLLNKMSYAEPAEQAQLYQQVVPLLEQAGLGTLAAPPGFKAGTPEAFTYARRTLGILDPTLMGKDAAERSRYRLSLELKRDPTAKEVSERKQLESAPALTVVKGLVDWNDGKGFVPAVTFAGTRGHLLGQHIGRNPKTDTIESVAANFRYMPTAAEKNAQIQAGDFQLIGEGVAEGLIQLSTFSKRNQDEIIPWAIKYWKEKYPERPPINFSVMKNMELGNMKLIGAQHSGPITALRSYMDEFQRVIPQAMASARRLQNMDVRLINMAANEIMANFAGTSKVAIEYQKFMTMQLNLASLLGKIISGTGSSTDETVRMGKQMLPQHHSLPQFLAAAETAKFMVDSRQTGLAQLSIWTPGGSIPTRGDQPAPLIPQYPTMMGLATEATAGPASRYTDAIRDTRTRLLGSGAPGLNQAVDPWNLGQTPPE